MAMNLSGLLPLYLRREPPGPVLLEHLDQPYPHRFDVVAYYDAACTRLAARWSWHGGRRPTRRHRRIVLNCWFWAARWLDPV